METVGVFKRAIAVIIDSVLLGIVGYLIATMTGSTTAEGFQLTGAPAMLLFLIGFAYYIVLEKTQGGTLGKKAMGLKVVKEDGSPIDWSAAIIRNLLRIIDGIVLYLIGAIAVWVSSKRQRLGDMAAKTLVVKAAWAAALLPLALLALAPAQSLAGNPRFGDMSLSDQKGGPAKSVFKPTTPKLYLEAKLLDMAFNTKLRAEWIAEKTSVAPPNYKIDTTELAASPMMNLATFSFSKPTAGWPEGDYRVDLFIDNKPAGGTKFRVVK